MANPFDNFEDDDGTTATATVEAAPAAEKNPFDEVAPGNPFDHFEDIPMSANGNPLPSPESVAVGQARTGGTYPGANQADQPSTVPNTSLFTEAYPTGDQLSQEIAADSTTGGNGASWSNLLPSGIARGASGLVQAVRAARLPGVSDVSSAINRATGTNLPTNVGDFLPPLIKSQNLDELPNPSTSAAGRVAYRTLEGGVEIATEAPLFAVTGGPAAEAGEAVTALAQKAGNALFNKVAPTLSRVAADSTNLAAFSGLTAPDNERAKSAAQGAEFGAALALAGLPAAALGQKVTQATGSALAGDIAGRTAKIIAGGSVAGGLSAAQGGDAEEVAKNALMVAIPGLAEETPLDLREAIIRRNAHVDALSNPERTKAVAAAKVADFKAAEKLKADLATSQAELEAKAQQVDQSRDAIRSSAQSILDTTPQVIALQDKIAQAKSRQMSAATIKTFAKQLVDLKKQRQKMADAHENLLDQHDNYVAELADAAQKRDDAITPVILNHPSVEPVGEPHPDQRANVERLVREGQGIFDRTGDSTVLESAQRQQRALDDQMIRAHKIEQDASDAEQRKFEAQRQADAEATRIESQGRTAPLPGEVPPEAQGAFEAQQNADAVNQNPEDAARQNLRQNPSLANTPISDVQAAAAQRVHNNAEAAYQRQSVIADQHLAALKAERMAPVIKAIADTAVSEARAQRDATKHATALGLDEKTAAEVGDIARQQARIEALAKRVQDQQNTRDFEGAIQTEREHNAALDRAMQKANAATARARAEAAASPAEKLAKQRGLSKLTDAERAEYDAAQKTLGKKIGEGLYANPAGLVFDPAVVKAVTTIAKSHFKNGIRTFRDLSKRLVDDYGVGVKPHLKAIWDEVSGGAGVKGAGASTSGSRLAGDGSRLSRVASSLLRNLAPEAQSKEAGLAASVLRTRNAERVNQSTRTAHALEVEKLATDPSGKKTTIRDVFAKQPLAENLDAIDRSELGKPQNTPGATTAFRKINDLIEDRWNQVRARSGIDTFIDNYFPHLYKNEKAAAQVLDQFRNKRGSFAGDAGFMKKRKYPTMKEALASNSNLEPLYTNPVDFALHRLTSLDRWLAAHDAVSDLEKAGIAVKAGPRENVPDGYRPLPDSVKVTKDGKTRYVPPGVGDVFDNYLGRGWSGDAYNALRATTHFLTSIKLGMSTFHGTFTGGQSASYSLGDAITPGGGRGAGYRLKQATRGLSGPVGSVLTWKQGRTGRQLAIKDQHSPAALAFDLAGARIGTQKTGAIRGFSDALKSMLSEPVIGDKAKAAASATAHAVPAGVEALAKPIMEWWVPNLKAGLLLHEVHRVYDSLPSDLKTVFDGGRDAFNKATPEQQEAIREPLQSAWRDIEHRIGQLDPDNLFVNPHIRSAAGMLVRAPAWNLGTLSSVSPVRLKSGKPVFAGRRIATLAAEALLTAGANSIITYAMTGTAPHGYDFLAARTGGKNPDGSDQRLVSPSYIAQLYHFGQHPIDTIKAKAADLLGAVGSILENRRYDGTMVVNPNAPLSRKIAQAVSFAKEVLTPISIASSDRLRDAGATPAERMMAFLGFSPAPRGIAATEAEKFAQDYLDNRRPASRTPEDAELQREISRARREAQRGNVTDQNKLIASGLMPAKLGAVPGMPLPNQFDIALHEMTPSDASELLSKMNSTESAKYLPVIQKKLATASKANKPLTYTQRQKLLADYQRTAKH